MSEEREFLNIDNGYQDNREQKGYFYTSENLHLQQESDVPEKAADKQGADKGKNSCNPQNSDGFHEESAPADFGESFVLLLDAIFKE